MKSFAQDYRISRKRFLMQSAFNTAFRLRKEIDNSPAVGAVQRQRINTLIDRCIATAQKILDIDVAIKANFNDFALQAEAVDAVSNTLVLLAGKEVSQARASIHHAHRLALVLMTVITLSGLIAALIIARGLNNRITRRVVNLTGSAEALRKGNLDVFAREEGSDELSLLSHTFNVMAARIRELIDNLELKVKERTAELSESERRFRQLFEHSSSGVAHDLNNILSGIVGYLELLLMLIPKESQLRKPIQAIHESDSEPLPWLLICLRSQEALPAPKNQPA